MSSFLDQLISFFRQVFKRTEQAAAGPAETENEPTPTSSMTPEAPPVEATSEPVIELPAPEAEETEITPVTRPLMLIIFNPPVPGLGGERLVQTMGWNNPQTLVTCLIDDLREVSNGYANFTISEQHEVDALPLKKDGFTYTCDDFIRCYHTQSGFHQPDAVDYYHILRDFDILTKIQSKAIDEVWMIAPPYSGFYESTMAGAGSFFCNAPFLADTEDCARRFVLMGFNYERGEGEMLESFSHRAESIVQQVYRNRLGEANLWERFTRVEKTNPGKSEVGTVHYAPNSQRAYDWGNHTLVNSFCENWLKYPDLSGDPIQVNCDNWGGGDIRLHHLWWLRHIPHASGLNGGIANNWWKYVVDVNTVK